MYNLSICLHLYFKVSSFLFIRFRLCARHGKENKKAAVCLLTFENRSLEFEFQRVRERGEEGVGVGLEAVVIVKVPPVCVCLHAPCEGPRSIQTRSNKAFPLSSLQNTKQNGEGEREREG